MLTIYCCALYRKTCSSVVRAGQEKTVETGIYRIQPVDATGAGDSFDAAFICGLCEGKRIEEAAKMAAAAGAINTAAFGPMEGKISVEAIDKMIKEE